MMLIIREENTCVHISVDIGEYVPFTVEINSSDLSPSPIYWRGGDGKRSLIEIGLDKKSGSVCSVTLTAIDPKKIKETTQPVNTNLPETYGMAVFDISTWGSESSSYFDNFQDEFGSDLILMLGEDYLTLKFENVREPVRYVRNNQLRFGVASNGMLSSLDILGLTEDEINRLRLV